MLFDAFFPHPQTLTQQDLLSDDGCKAPQEVATAIDDQNLGGRGKEVDVIGG